jgi:hypothetical protein
VRWASPSGAGGAFRALNRRGHKRYHAALPVGDEFGRCPLRSYCLAGGTLVENMSRSNFHLPPSCFQTTTYFP